MNTGSEIGTHGTHSLNAVFLGFRVVLLLFENVFRIPVSIFLDSCSRMPEKINRTMEKREKTQSKEEAIETFEKIPLYVAFLAYMGFYVLLFLGFVSQFLFPPKVAKEKNRKVKFFSVLILVFAKTGCNIRYYNASFSGLSTFVQQFR